MVQRPHHHDRFSHRAGRATELEPAGSPEDRERWRLAAIAGSPQGEIAARQEIEPVGLNPRPRHHVIWIPRRHEPPLAIKIMTKELAWLRRALAELKKWTRAPEYSHHGPAMRVIPSQGCGWRAGASEAGSCATHSGETPEEARRLPESAAS